MATELAILSKNERKRHAGNVATIHEGAAMYLMVGKALADEQVNKLYREEYATFEEFIAAEFQMAKTHAYGQIAAFQCHKQLSTSAMADILPANERVLRQLVTVPVDGRAECWAEVVKTAPTVNGKPHITADHAKDVAKTYRHETTNSGAVTGTYRVLYADPPWKYADARGDDPAYGAATGHYPCQSIDELCNLKDEDDRYVTEWTRDNAVLFMWVTSPFMDVFHEVSASWGFKYKATFVWDKVRHNFGHYNSARHEFLTISTKGSCTPDTKATHDSVQVIERTARHSEKPEAFRDIIDELYPPPKDGDNDRLELFARKKPGSCWDVWGNQIG